MWLSILQRHFPSSSWKKYYPKIMFHVLSVFHGLKASLLWDFGPMVTPEQIYYFLKDFETQFNNLEPVSVIVIDKDIFLTNISQCLKSLNFDKFFIEITKNTFRLIKSAKNEFLREMIELLKNKLIFCKDCGLCKLSYADINCPPCFYGLLLNYPVIYYFRYDYQPFFIELKVYTVSCQFSFDKISGKYQTFSFSIPQSLVNESVDHCISMWFNGLQLPDTNIFTNLSLESTFEDVDALILCGLLKEAAYYYRKCLEVKPHFIRASYNLENVSNLAVERWHFRMLNDNYRNESFRKAISKRIMQGFDRILDIGTGTGILSMFCAEGKAKEIYACDSSSIMIEIAEKVFQRNNATGIKLINKHSSKLQLPTDIPRRVSLVITETVDSGLFGEDILFTLLNAWENLLLPPCNDFQNLKNSDNFGCVIPFGAIIYLTAIECDIISNALYLKETDNLFTFENCNIYPNNEDYDTQDLKRVPFKYLTDIKKVMSINFNNPCLIKEMLDEERVEIFKLKIKTPGRLDCFAIWFDLLLDENIVLNTGPESESNVAWDQAIFSLPKCMFVEKSQEIIVKVSVKNGKLNVKCNERFCEENKKVFEPTEEVIKTLNNVKLVETLRQVEKNLLKVFDYSVRIMDCFAFPIFGLNFLMSRGKNFQDILTCFVPSEKDRELVSFVAKENNIEERISIMVECDFESYCETNQSFDIILLDFVEKTGELKEQIPLKMPYLRSTLNCGGVILPEDITIVGQFIYSDWLIRTSRVIGVDSTCGLEIGEYINFYQIRHFIGINFDVIEKSIGTSAFELFSLYSCEESKKMSVASLSSHINAMVYWFKIRFMENCDEIYTCDKTSLYQQCAFLYPKIKTSHKIEFLILRNDGLFKIELLR